MKKTREQLNGILPQLKQRLVGFYSKEFDSTVTDVLITPDHINHASAIWRLSKSGAGYAALESDNLTIVVALENDEIISVRRFVREDALSDLIPLVQDLDYMQLNPTDNNLGTKI